jgi:hypothetical protein
MDHEVVPRPCTLCDLVVELFPGPLQCTPKKNVRLTMEIEVPKRCIFRPTSSTNMVQRVFMVGESKEVFLFKKKRARAHNEDIMCFIYIYIRILLGGRKEKMSLREDKRMIKLYFIFLKKNALFDVY